MQIPAIVLTRPFQYAESSCQGVALPVKGGLQMKWLDHRPMSGPTSGSTRSRASGDSRNSSNLESRRWSMSRSSSPYLSKSSSKIAFSRENISGGSTGLWYWR